MIQVFFSMRWQNLYNTLVFKVDGWYKINDESRSQNRSNIYEELLLSGKKHGKNRHLPRPTASHPSSLIIWSCDCNSLQIFMGDARRHTNLGHTNLTHKSSLSYLAMHSRPSANPWRCCWSGNEKTRPIWAANHDKPSTDLKTWSEHRPDLNDLTGPTI